MSANAARADFRVNHLEQAPHAFVECGYYAYLFHAYFGVALGLARPMLGVGLLLMLAGLCILRHGVHVIEAYRPIALPLVFAASYVGVQVLVHNENLMGDYVRDFVPWMLLLVLIQSLCRREGFLERFAIVAGLIGFAVLPYLDLAGVGSGVARARLTLEGSGGLENSNALAEWFGFCCIIFTITGIESRRLSIRVPSWSVAGVCLMVVGLTVSRGTLLAVVVAVIIACRRLLKRGFLPLLMLMVLIWTGFLLGLHEQATTAYGQRGLEESGRFLVWPVAIGRFLASPWLGVGASNVPTFVPIAGAWITPHNSFIFVAMVSGVVPLIFYVAYWATAARGAFVASTRNLVAAPFQLPLFTFALLTAQSSNLTFMSPWAVVILATAIRGGIVSRADRRALREARVRHLSQRRSPLWGTP
jgi:O-antigen ligase